MKMKTKGFTLIETLVAVAILVLATTGAFSAAQMGIVSSTYSKNQVIAFYLAQEAVEYIRNTRDNNGLQGQNWLSGISLNSSDPCYFGNICTVDLVNATLSRCPGGLGSCSFLKQDLNGFYNHFSGTDTAFRREIELKVIGPREISVRVSLSWKNGTINRTFNIRENIFDWQTTS